MKVKRFFISNISTALFMVFALTMLFSPDAKAMVLQGLMKVGLFQPVINEEKPRTPINSLTSGIQFKDGTGKIINLSELKGKVVFINFWATWCAPCIAEMPSIEKLYQSMKDNKNVVFLMVDVDDDYLKSKKFMDRKKFTLPVFTPGSAIPESLMDGAIPTTIIFDKKGNLVFRHEGASDYSDKKVVDYLNTLSNE
ncbi:MAG TPA: TlpA disulfide reductase family protein [Sphingobacteriaceae bacterium]|nr:TlpA disulfide reductase family protein [Sphingobacteriaceae bacterium]